MNKYTKEILKLYIKKDLKANGGLGNGGLYYTEIRKYLKLLRKCEYLSQKKNALSKIHYLVLIFKFHRLGIKLGFEVPLNCIGPGLKIDHWGFLAINDKAKIGKNLHIYGDITIGVKNAEDSKAPELGDNITIGAGARILGPIRIASNCIIGANAVVTHSVLEEGKVIAGVPAKVIGNVK